MVFAIIAAGEGSRLAQEGVALPKPLVPLQGKPMIERLMGIFMHQGAEKIVVIVNEENKATQAHLVLLKESGAFPLEIVVKSTPSSMHSFHAIAPYLESERFCLTTVDTIFSELEFANYLQAFREDATSDGYMAVTSYIDDEKPLYLSTTETNAITGFHDTPPALVRYISGGVYCLTPAAIPTLNRCLEQGNSRMRNFQRALIEDGLKLTAYPFQKIIDVDHAEDIAKAEQLLNTF